MNYDTYLGEHSKLTLRLRNKYSNPLAIYPRLQNGLKDTEYEKQLKEIEKDLQKGLK